MVNHHLVIESIEDCATIKVLAQPKHEPSRFPRFWLINLEERNEDYSLLSVPEKHQASLHKRIDIRRHFVTRLGVLRSILSCVTGKTAHELRLRKGIYGKPFLIDGPAFNTSHSEHWLFVGVGGQQQIGVDIEAIRHLPDFDSVASYCLTQAERQQLNAVPQGKRLEAFYAFWTIKEAVLKASGYGLNLPLTDISVRLNDLLEPTRVELMGSIADEFKLRYW